MNKKHVSFCFGRLNPPHYGHSSLIEAVKKDAKHHGGDWFIFTSKSHDKTVSPKNKNPIPYSEKVQWIDLINPGLGKHFVRDSGIAKTFLEAAAYLYSLGYTSATFVAGDEDMPIMKPTLVQYNHQERDAKGNPHRHGFYAFHPFLFHENPRVTSATSARQAAIDNDADAFFAATKVPKEWTVNGKTLMQATRAGLVAELPEPEEPVVQKKIPAPKPAKQLNTVAPKEKVMKKGPAQQLAEARRPYGDYFDDSGISARPGHDEGEPVYDPRYDRIGAGDPRGSGHQRSSSHHQPTMTGMYFYDVKPDQEEDAEWIGVKKTKSGKWALVQHDTSGATFRYKKRLADQKFGPGKFWSPKKDNHFQENQWNPAKELAEAMKNKQEAPKPRNFVAKNAIQSGAGAHKDKKKAMKQGDVKHKGKLEFAEGRLSASLNTIFEEKYEVLYERDIHASGKKLPIENNASLKGGISIPGISQTKSNGNPYAGYRFALALAGAPEFPTEAAGAIAGDPLLSTYTDEELEMVKFAAKQVGAGSINRLTNSRSEEVPGVNKQSVVAKIKRNKYGI